MTTYEYDKNGRLMKTIDPDGTYTRDGLRRAGRQKESYDKARRETSYEYDR